MWSDNSDFQELPLFILKKKAVVNVINNDQRSFGYSILSAKYYSIRKNSQRANHYDSQFNAEHLNNLPYPVSIADMEKYEGILNLNINILTFSDVAGRVLTPIYISNKNCNQAIIDLLYWSGHFAWIRNRNRLLAHLSKRKMRLHYCLRCFSHFNSESKLNSHEGVCFKSKESASIIHSFSNSAYQNQGSSFLNNSTHNTTPKSNHITTSNCSTTNSTSTSGLPQIRSGPKNVTKRVRGRPAKEATLTKRNKPIVGEGERKVNGEGEGDETWMRWLTKETTTLSPSIRPAPSVAYAAEKLELEEEVRIEASIASAAADPNLE